MAAFAPIPRAKVTATVAHNVRARAKERIASFRSRRNDMIVLPWGQRQGPPAVLLRPSASRLGKSGLEKSMPAVDRGPRSRLWGRWSWPVRTAASRRSVQELGARACGELDSVPGNECLPSIPARARQASRPRGPYFAPETQRLIPGYAAPPGTGTAAATALADLAVAAFARRSVLPVYRPRRPLASPHSASD